MTCSRCSSPADASTLCAACLAADAVASRVAQGLDAQVDEVAATRLASMLRPYTTRRAS